MESSLWDRSKYAFEQMLEQSEQASVRLAEHVEGIGARARARVERARVERHLFRRFAQLGNRVYELWNERPAPAEGSPWGDAAVQEHLTRLRELDEQLHKAESRLTAAD